MDKFVYKDILIDFNTRLISQNRESLTLDPKAFNTLALLIENNDRVVSNEELIEKVWDERPTTNEVVTASIGRVRKLFKKAGVESEVIRTAHKVGYQFVLAEASLENEHNQAFLNPQRLRYFIWLNTLILVCLTVAGTLVARQYTALQQTGLEIKDTELPRIDNSTNLNASRSTKPTEIFFIRHAERDPNAEDPPLSKLGIARAKRWRTLLDGINFDQVLTTSFIRSTQTADLVFSKDVAVSYYSPLSFEIADEIELYRGKKIAIIGHGNTIPGMVNRLITDRQYDAMDHNDHELIYLVTIDSSGGASSNELKLDYFLE